MGHDVQISGSRVSKSLLLARTLTKHVILSCLCAADHEGQVEVRHADLPAQRQRQPAYLAAERKEMAAVKAKNMKATEAKRKGLIGKGAFELADYIKKAVGEVGSGKEYYQSGR